jgi:ribulose kinase
MQDFLTYRATSSTQRSSCSLVCKCSYIPESGWQSSFFEKIGLEELVRTRYKQVGEGEVLTAGVPVGKGLTSAAATELGLHTGTAVGSAVIDAYASRTFFPPSIYSHFLATRAGLALLAHATKRREVMS